MNDLLRPLGAALLLGAGCLASADHALAQSLEGKIVAQDAGANDLLGESLAISGDTIVAGARHDASGTGAGYVFRRGAGGTWAQEAKLVPAAAAAADQVGTGVDVDGDTLVLGAPDPFDPFGAASGPGAVHVYRRSGTTWSPETALAASDGQGLDQLGAAVSIAGERALAGAPGDEAAGQGSRFAGRGAAYVFRRTGTSWSQEAKLVGAGSASGDLCGRAVALGDDLAVMGAPGDDDDGMDAGAVYVFRRSGTNWNQEQKLTAADGTAGDGFGGAVALSGDVILVGAGQKTVSGSAAAGAVYVFRFGGASWAQEQKLTAPLPQANARFGASVAVSGAEAVVGALGVESAHLFLHDGGSWSETGVLGQPNTALFGAAVDLGPDLVCAGAPLTTDGGPTFSGAIYAWCTNPGPSLASLSPTSGIFNQSTPVTILGANFSAVKAQTVTFGGVAATNVTYVSDGELTCDAPPGPLGATVDVTVVQKGIADTLVGAFTYTGLSVTSVSPASGPAVNGPPVTILGSNFVNDGSTVVTFGGVAANVVSVTPPSTIVVDPPTGVRGTTVDVAVSASTGSATLPMAYTYEVLSITASSLAAGNLLGGHTVTLTVDYPTNLADTSATVGGSPVPVLSVTGNDVSILIPGVAEPPGPAVDVTVTNGNGTATLAGGWTWTPGLVISVSGTAAAGGTVSIDWSADPAAAPGQTITLWVADPLVPPANLAVGGIAGLFQSTPLLFFQPFQTSLGGLNLPFGPLPAGIAGFPLSMQGLVTGEGKVIGSFTNRAGFVIP